MNHRTISRTTLALIIMAYAAFAQALPITGKLWHVPEVTAQSAIPANVPGTTADVTFDVNSPINFFGTGATVGTWLSNGSAYNVVENTAGHWLRSWTMGHKARSSNSLALSASQTGRSLP